MNRIYGKPNETVVQQIPPNPAHAVIASMTLEQKLALLQMLKAGEPPGLPVVEQATTDGSG